MIDIPIDIDRSEIPGSAAAGSVIAALGDFVLYGGDTILEIIIILGSTAEAWLPFVSHLSRIATVSDAIPREPVQAILLVLSALLVIYYGTRIIRRIISNLRD